MIDFDSATYDKMQDELRQRMALYAPTLSFNQWQSAALARVFVPVKIPDWGSMSGNQRRDIKKWCQERFDDRWVWSFDTYYFVDPKEALAFRLRWV